MPSSSEGDMLLPGQVIRSHWKIVRKIGGGGFGEIYEAVDCTSSNEQVAVKVESSKANKQVLKMEVAVLRRLQGKKHACKFYGCGRNEKFNYMVMSLQGRNLADLRRESPRQCFSISTGIRLALQVLRAIEDIHSVGFLHRDIKPSNFAIGGSSGTSRLVIMLDFGLARQYLNQKGELRSPRSAAGFRGTVRYASVTAHQNREMGRHDDLWSLFYMMVEFLHGSLPWRKIKDKEEVGRMKHEMSGERLTEGLPEELRLFAAHLEKLTYGDTPNYGYLNGCLVRILEKYKISMEDPFDWEMTVSERKLVTVQSCREPLVALNGTAGEVNGCHRKGRSALQKQHGDGKADGTAKRGAISSHPPNGGGRIAVGRTSSDTSARGVEFFRHLRVETSLENEQSPPDHRSEREVNVEFNLHLPSRASKGRSTSAVNLQPQDAMIGTENGVRGTQEMPRVASTPRMLRVFCRKKSKSRPNNADISCTQFAVADDDAVSTHLKGSGTGAITLVSRWQASFDESIEDEDDGGAEAMPVESYAEKSSDRKSVKKECTPGREGPPKVRASLARNASLTRTAGKAVTPANDKQTTVRTVESTKLANVVFSLGSDQSNCARTAELPVNEDKALRANGSIKTGGSGTFIGQLRSIRSNLQDILGSAKSVGDVRSQGAKAVHDALKETTAVPAVAATTSTKTQGGNDRDARRLRRYRRRSDCESFRELVQKMENLSRGANSASYGQQTFTSGAIVVPPYQRKISADAVNQVNKGNSSSSYRSRAFDKANDLSSFQPNPKTFSLTYGH